jgi:hypothetical protein
MAVNYAGGHSKEWDFGYDNVDRRVAVGKSGDQLGLFLGDDVDWVRLSLLLFLPASLPLPLLFWSLFVEFPLPLSSCSSVLLHAPSHK